MKIKENRTYIGSGNLFTLVVDDVEGNGLVAQGSSIDVHPKRGERS